MNRAHNLAVASALLAEALVDSLQGGNAEPDEMVAYGTVVELVGGVLERLGIVSAASFAWKCLLRPERQAGAGCPEACCCVCHLTQLDACEPCCRAPWRWVERTIPEHDSESGRGNS